jgi:hypothetical protein
MTVLMYTDTSLALAAEMASAIGSETIQSLVFVCIYRTRREGVQKRIDQRDSSFSKLKRGEAPVQPVAPVCAQQGGRTTKAAN